MININKETLEEAIFVIASIVERCENAQTKFREGTSQHISQRDWLKQNFCAWEVDCLRRVVKRRGNAKHQTVA